MDTIFTRLPVRRACLAALAGLWLASAAWAVDPTDRQVSDAIEDRLRQDPGVSCEGIDVSVANGLVTLSGRVGHLPACRRAGALAETVRGVRAVINRVTVAPRPARSDEAVRRDIEKALLYDPATAGYPLKVRVAKGVATLTGGVRGWADKELIESVAAAVLGVVQVNNALQAGGGGTRTDEQIEAEVHQVLRWDALVDHAMIDVRVFRGDVRLTGMVASAAEAARARTDAWVQGADTVDASQLQVRRWARDKELRQGKHAPVPASQRERAVRAALAREPRVSPFAVTAEIGDEAVVLRGTVDNLLARRTAQRVLERTVGLPPVINRLKVRPSEGHDDAQTATDIRNALRRDPYLACHAIQVSVADGAARLSGAVDTHFQRARADDLAAMARGVLRVHNRLEVDLSHRPFVYDPYLDVADPRGFAWYDHQPRLSFRADDDIRQEVCERLRWSPFVNAEPVQVVVRSGIATLTGAVGCPVQRRAAVENAYAGGATWVIDELKLEPSPPPEPPAPPASQP